MTTTTTTPAIDTKRVTGRRTLRFTTLDEVLAEAERVAAADRDGALKQLGNWTAGQTFGHLAAWIDYGFDGYPAPTPWFVRVLGRLMKKKAVTGGAPAGFRIPRVPGGTYARDPLPTADGLARLTRAAARLKSAPPPAPNPVFGPLTHAEWTQLHLRHAELHLSFLVPEGARADQVGEGS